MSRGVHLRGSEPAVMGEDGGDKREYLRVAARLRVRERILAPGEFDGLRLEIETHERPVKAEIDPTLQVYFERLELKLDRILSLLDAGISQPIASVEPRDVEISGAGICMTTMLEPPPYGARCLIELLLPKSSVPLRVIGSVRSQFDGGIPGEGSELAMAFEVIHESDREVIVRFALEMERCAVRHNARSQAEEL